MYCTNCGKELSTGDQFCAKCGRAINGLQKSSVQEKDNTQSWIAGLSIAVLLLRIPFVLPLLGFLLLLCGSSFYFRFIYPSSTSREIIDYRDLDKQFYTTAYHIALIVRPERGAYDTRVKNQPLIGEQNYDRNSLNSGIINRGDSLYPMGRYEALELVIQKFQSEEGRQELKGYLNKYYNEMAKGKQNTDPLAEDHVSKVEIERAIVLEWMDSYVQRRIVNEKLNHEQLMDALIEDVTRSGIPNKNVCTFRNAWTAYRNGEATYTVCQIGLYK